MPETQTQSRAQTRAQTGAPSRPGAHSEGRLPERVSMPLLTLITQQSLDEDYRHVAERRAAGVDRSGRPHWVAAVVVAAFGLIVTIAALQTSERAGVESASRATLIAQVEEGQEELAELQRQLQRLREQNVGLQSALDERTAEQLAAETRVERIAASSGFGPVTGPGVRIVVDDAPDGGERVRDRDLRPLVDGLWNAGAEAIAINGQRLTARSAIRNSGFTIRVTGNNRNLSPPYTIAAIGDTDTLQARLMQTTSGLRFRSIADFFGFPWTMNNVEELSLPGAPPRLARLRSAMAGTAAENASEEPEGMKDAMTEATQ